MSIQYRAPGFELLTHIIISSVCESQDKACLEKGLVLLTAVLVNGNKRTNQLQLTHKGFILKPVSFISGLPLSEPQAQEFRFEPVLFLTSDTIRTFLPSYGLHRNFQLQKLLMVTIVSSGLVGSAVASNSRGPRFKSNHRKFLHWTFIFCQLYWKDKNKENIVREWPIKKAIVCWIWDHESSFSDHSLRQYSGVLWPWFVPWQGRWIITC